MFVTSHVLSGAAIGSLAPGPLTALGAGFVSHFVLDALPHWGSGDEDLLKVAVPDGLTGLAAIGAVAAMTVPRRRLPVLAGVFGACLPDVDKPAELFVGRSPFPHWFDAFHSGIQREAPHRMRHELVVAAVLAVAAGALLRRHRCPGAEPRRAHRARAT